MNLWKAFAIWLLVAVGSYLGVCLLFVLLGGY